MFDDRCFDCSKSLRVDAVVCCIDMHKRMLDEGRWTATTHLQGRAVAKDIQGVAGAGQGHIHPLGVGQETAKRKRSRNRAQFC